MDVQKRLEELETLVSSDAKAIENRIYSAEGGASPYVWKQR